MLFHRVLPYFFNVIFGILIDDSVQFNVVLLEKREILNIRVRLTMINVHVFQLPHNR